MIPPEARVLVCLIANPRDLEIARWDHWYRTQSNMPRANTWPIT